MRYFRTVYALRNGTQKAKKEGMQRKKEKNNEPGEVLRDERLERARVTEGRKVSEGVKEVIRLQPEGQDMISDG